MQSCVVPMLLDWEVGMGITVVSVIKFFFLHNSEVSKIFSNAIDSCAAMVGNFACLYKKAVSSGGCRADEKFGRLGV